MNKTCNNRFLWKVFVTLGLCLILMLSVVACSKKRTPAENFIYLQKKALIESVTQGLSSSADTAKNAEAFSDDISIVLSQADIGEVLVDVKADVAADGKKGLMSASVGMMGMTIDIGTITWNEEQYGFYIPMLDSNYYVITPEAAINAINAYLPEGEKLEVGELTASQAESIEMVLQMASMWSKYGELVLSVVKEENVTETQETLTILDQQVTCQVYTFQPAAQDLEEMFTTLLTQMQQDQELKDLLVKLYGLGSTASGSDAMTAEEFMQSFESALVEGLANAPELAKEIADAQTKWSIAAEEERIHQQKLEMDGINVILYQNVGQWKDGRKDALYISDSESEATYFISDATYTGSKLTGSIRYGYGQEDFCVLQYDLNPEEKSSLNIPVGSISVELEGVPFTMVTTKQEDGSMLTEMKMEYYGEVMSMNITTTEKGSTVQAPTATPVDISGYSKEDLEALFYGMANGLTGVY